MQKKHEDGEVFYSVFYSVFCSDGLYEATCSVECFNKGVSANYDILNGNILGMLDYV